MRVQLRRDTTFILHALVALVCVAALMFCMAGCASLWLSVKQTVGPTLGAIIGAALGTLLGPAGSVIGGGLGAMVGHAVTLNAALLSGEMHGAPPVKIPGVPDQSMPWMLPPAWTPSMPWYLTWRGGLVAGILWIMWLKRLYLWEVLKDFRSGVKTGLASTGKFAVNATWGGNAFRRPVKPKTAPARFPAGA